MKDNVLIVRSNYEDPESLFEKLSPDVEWHEMQGFPYGGVYTGPAQVAENVFRHIESDWNGFRAVPSEFIGAGDTVVTLGHYEGQCVQSGKSMKAAFAHIYTLRDGKIVRFRQYADSALVVQAMQ